MSPGHEPGGLESAEEKQRTGGGRGHAGRLHLATWGQVLCEFTYDDVIVYNCKIVLVFVIVKCLCMFTRELTN